MAVTEAKKLIILVTKHRIHPPWDKDIAPFEKDIRKIIRNIKFKTNGTKNKLQKEMNNDIRTMKSDSRLIIAADKTRNFYRVELEQYQKLVKDNVTSLYKKVDSESLNQVNAEAK